MRKALKIILPLVLVLVLLITAYWFFFQYRRDITAGVFVQLGDGRVQAKKYADAVTWYDYANRLEPTNVETAIKLAEAYRNSGNYTKTEYVLVNAIYASPDNADLYMTLSRVYVEQDKMMDAQIMLDQIRNEAVREQLTKLRPAAPVVTPEGGFYSDRISVEVESGSNASCYLSVGGGFPSSDEYYSGPVELPLGESTVCAVAVSSEGLVSPAVYVGYTIAGVIEQAEFVDESFEHYVQELLNRGNRSMKTNDLWSVASLDLPAEVQTLQDLRYFTGLSELTLHSLGDGDLSILPTLTGLKKLTLSGCELTSEQLTAVGSCRNLEELRLSGCGLSNITPLEGLEKLRVLDLSDNSINNLSPISNLTALETLLLSSNAVTSVNALNKLANLRVLDLSHNVIKSLTHLAQCTAMRELNVSNNELTSLAGLEFMAELEILDASKNQVTDASQLAGCLKLRQFTMTDNLLTSVDFLSGIKAIENVNIDYNDVVAVPAFASDCKLVTFSAAHNFLDDLSGFADLPSLNYVNADYNNITDISVLASCPNLTQVNVFGTYIHDGGVLEANGVIVNYTPDVS